MDRNRNRVTGPDVQGQRDRDRGIGTTKREMDREKGV